MSVILGISRTTRQKKTKNITTHLHQGECPKMASEVKRVQQLQREVQRLSTYLFCALLHSTVLSILSFLIPVQNRSGWLTKQGGRMKNWRRRWFAIKDAQ